MPASVMTRYTLQRDPVCVRANGRTAWMEYYFVHMLHPTKGWRYAGRASRLVQRPHMYAGRGPSPIYVGRGARAPTPYLTHPPWT